MSPHPIVYNNKKFLTAEALFQSMRFSDEQIIEKIREQKSPMSAKMVAKANKSKMIITPLSDSDINNMNICLRLKIEQHPMLAQELKSTENKIIVEDVSKRKNKGSALFWGAAIVDGKLEGKNMLGQLWMDIRKTITNK
jgi:ribA/ribD-fused uncharacterized protein